MKFTKEYFGDKIMKKEIKVLGCLAFLFIFLGLIFLHISTIQTEISFAIYYFLGWVVCMILSIFFIWKLWKLEPE